MTKISRPMIRIHNIETDEVIDREMNDAEFAQYEADQAANKVAEEARAKAEADKAALLARLGLTEDELKTILG
jgi:crotonobetainyl-CoA:carnitine CoA-transferase CaiB-like acyl-CoA transferase